MFCDSSLDLRQAAACLLARHLSVTTARTRTQATMPLPSNNNEAGSALVAEEFQEAAEVCGDDGCNPVTQISESVQEWPL